MEENVEVKEEKAETDPEELKKLRIKAAASVFHGGLITEGTSKIGITKKSKKISKLARKTSRASRKKNQQIKNKVKRPTGSKKRK